MRTLQYNSTTKITLPNEMSFTNSRYQYVMVEYSDTQNHKDTLEVRYGSNIRVTLKRESNAKKTVVFPLTSVLESIAMSAETNVLKDVKLYYNNSLLSMDLNTVIVGTSDREAPSFETVAASGESVVYKTGVVLYPNFLPDDYQLQRVPFFIGTTSRTSFKYRSRLSLSIASGINQIVYTSDDVYPFYYVTIGKYASEPNLRGELYFEAVDNEPAGTTTFSWVRMPVTVDFCTDGIFLKWIDKSGVPRLYRWTQESTDEEAEVEETFTCLDDTLQPYDVQDKTLTKRYVLHSRMVEQDVFDLCRTIIGGRDLFMWDNELSDWVRCYLDDADDEDGGDILKDMTIEVVRKEYHI